MKSVLIGATLALAPVAAAALTITSNGPTNGGTINLAMGDIFLIEINGNASDGSGSAVFGFTAVSNLGAIETNSLNPTGGFANTTVEWNSAADGSGTSFGSLTHAQVAAGTQLTTVFAAGDTKYLIATWTDVTANLSNFDLRIAAVPVPAAGLLLLTALGGLALARRKRQAA